MARIQILNLPGDGQPFALVIDQAGEDYDGLMNLPAGVDERLGARGILVFENSIEIADSSRSDTVDGGTVTVTVKVVPDLSAFAPAVEAAIDDANQRLAAARTGLKADQEQYCPLCPSAPLLTADAMATHMRTAHPITEIAGVFNDG